MNSAEIIRKANLEPLDKRSKYLRSLVIRAIEKGKRGHIGPALSIMEIIRVLYDHVMKYRAENPKWPERDRFILSKGHGCLGLYAVLADKGFFPLAELDRFCHFDSILGGHPEVITPGVEASTGALGHGLSIGIGQALALRIKKLPGQVFVLMGDGEINEGSVWEAAACAHKHQLSNLTAIIDYNKIQSAGPVSEIMDMEPLADKWRSFGFAVTECNGHNIEDLNQAFGPASVQKGLPRAIICHTVKGKGVLAAEHNPEWHHMANLDPETLGILYESLGSK